jgi:hypothetical protein
LSFKNWSMYLPDSKNTYFLSPAALGTHGPRDRIQPVNIHVGCLLQKHWK